MNYEAHLSVSQPLEVHGGALVYHIDLGVGGRVFTSTLVAGSGVPIALQCKDVPTP